MGYRYMGLSLKEGSTKKRGRSCSYVVHDRVKEKKLRRELGTVGLQVG